MAIVLVPKSVPTKTMAGVRMSNGNAEFDHCGSIGSSII
jgi:hypothetical protein